MTSISNLPNDVTWHIFSFLSSSEILKMRAVSRKHKMLAEKTVKYTELQKKVKKVCVKFQKRISALSLKKEGPLNFLCDFDKLYSDKEEVKIITRQSKFLCRLNPSSEGRPKLIPLQSQDKWYRVFWTEGLVATVGRNTGIPQSVSANNPRGVDDPFIYVNIFDTTNGSLLQEYKSVTCFPICWSKRSLLLHTNSHSSVRSLLYWDCLNNREPVTLCSPEYPFSKMISHDRENAYGRVRSGATWPTSKPFYKLDVSSQTLTQLNYEIKEQWHPIKNFGITSSGNLFFSKKRTITLLSGNDAKEVMKMDTPCLPRKLRFQFPLLTFIKDDSRFVIYDIRKTDKALFEYDYYSLSDKFSAWINDHPPHSPLGMGNLLFHDSFIIVNRTFELDCFTLNGFSLLNYVPFFGSS